MSLAGTANRERFEMIDEILPLLTIATILLVAVLISPTFPDGDTDDE